MPTWAGVFEDRSHVLYRVLEAIVAYDTLICTFYYYYYYYTWNIFSDENLWTDERNPLRRELFQGWAVR